MVNEATHSPFTIIHLQFTIRSSHTFLNNNYAAGWGMTMSIHRETRENLLSLMILDKPNRPHGAPAPKRRSGLATETHSATLLQAVVSFCLVFLLVLHGSAVRAQSGPASLQSITTNDLKRHLSFLASDELGGRYPFSTSGPIAARYLATQLASYGYRGAGPDSSFFQNVPLTHGTIDISQSHLSVTVGGVALTFTYESDYMLETPGEIPDPFDVLIPFRSGKPGIGKDLPNGIAIDPLHFQPLALERLHDPSRHRALAGP